MHRILAIAEDRQHNGQMISQSTIQLNFAVMAIDRFKTLVSNPNDDKHKLIIDLDHIDGADIQVSQPVNEFAGVYCTEDGLGKIIGRSDGKTDMAAPAQNTVGHLLAVLSLPQAMTKAISVATANSAAKLPASHCRRSE